jgi:hypothetical protein
MKDLKNCASNIHSVANSECKKEIACNVFKGDECKKVRKECETRLINQLKDNCQSKFMEIEERCEREVKQTFEEKKHEIEDTLKALFDNDTKCSLAPKSCEQMKIEARETLTIRNNKEMADELIKCKHGRIA